MVKQVIPRPDGSPWPVLKPLCRQLSRSIRVARQVCIIGSHSRVHLPLHSSMVSRSHAAVVTDGGATYIRDLASSNGLYVNGAAVREGKLLHGDVLGIGPFTFRWNCVVLPPPRQRPLGPRTAWMDGVLDVAGEIAPRPISGRTVLIGNRDGCDILTRDSRASSAQTLIYRRLGRLYIRDLNSEDGTFLNGRPIREAALQGGDEIRVGSMTIVFRQRESVAGPDDYDSAIQDAVGLAGAATGDRPHSRRFGTAPTIEQLLGAPAFRITKWERLEPFLQSGSETLLKSFR